ncbi:hypothetical protein GQ44DRAFT_416024 [Phaeosphaeriaceae sp. PMI808]|nr:hypothetical protein GQ44DRAFT_416024 [Phaeosphaeriaceae sp. PMI808]
MIGDPCACTCFHGKRGIPAPPEKTLKPTSLAYKGTRRPRRLASKLASPPEPLTLPCYLLSIYCCSVYPLPLTHSLHKTHLLYLIQQYTLSVVPFVVIDIIIGSCIIAARCPSHLLAWALAPASATTALSCQPHFTSPRQPFIPGQPQNLACAPSGT